MPSFLGRAKLLPNIGAPADYFHETELHDEGKADIDDVAEGEPRRGERHAGLRGGRVREVGEAARGPTSAPQHRLGCAAASFKRKDGVGTAGLAH